jgi:hypothetical protein
MARASPALASQRSTAIHASSPAATAPMMASSALRRRNASLPAIR